MPTPLFRFDNTYATELEGFYQPIAPEGFPEPRLLLLNEALCAELGLDANALRASAAQIVAGNEVPEGAAPLAQAYAGHQFGGLTPQLGDGRALLLGEVLDPKGRRVDLQLKGSGRTPFSRGGDGRATLGPVLREYLMGEAMWALGVPTTRALAAITTGEQVRRTGLLPGAVLARVAASHLRVGTFVFFAVRSDVEKVRQLTDYALARHFPAAQARASGAPPALTLLREVVRAQAELIAQWMLIGFIHGVMNTDNMTISGETIDYGPCAFMDAYHPGTVFSSIDQHGRYAYGNQPGIGQWNLARLAETLLPLIDDDEAKAIEIAQEELGVYVHTYEARWLEGMRAKLGLTTAPTEEESDGVLCQRLLTLMEHQKVDYTRLFRSLSAGVRGDLSEARGLFADPAEFDAWSKDWRAALARASAAPGDVEEIAAAMDATNPIYIPRNHKVEEALEAAHAGDLGPFQKLFEVLQHPFEARPGLDAYASPAGEDFGPYQTFCGT